jgi:hypothetical protein
VTLVEIPAFNFRAARLKKIQNQYVVVAYFDFKVDRLFLYKSEICTDFHLFAGVEKEFRTDSSQISQFHNSISVALCNYAERNCTKWELNELPTFGIAGDAGLICHLINKHMATLPEGADPWNAAGVSFNMKQVYNDFSNHVYTYTWVIKKPEVLSALLPEGVDISFVPGQFYVNNKIDFSDQMVPGIQFSLPLKLVARTDSSNISISFHKAHVLKMSGNTLVEGTYVERVISVDSHQDSPVHFSMWDLHARSDTSKWQPIPGSCKAPRQKVALYGLGSKNATRFHICVNINDLVCAQGLVKVCIPLLLLVISHVNLSNSSFTPSYA